MTADDFTAALRGLGMTQAQLAKRLGLDRNSPSRWATGLTPVPQAVVLLLRTPGPPTHDLIPTTRRPRPVFELSHRHR